MRTIGFYLIVLAIWRKTDQFAPPESEFSAKGHGHSLSLGSTSALISCNLNSGSCCNLPHPTEKHLDRCGDGSCFRKRAVWKRTGVQEDMDRTRETTRWQYLEGFPGGSDGKESACSAGDLGSIRGWGRSPGIENATTLQYAHLGNPMDRGAWWATVCEVQRIKT